MLGFDCVFDFVVVFDYLIDSGAFGFVLTVIASGFCMSCWWVCLLVTFDLGFTVVCCDFGFCWSSFVVWFCGQLVGFVVWAFCYLE